MCSNLKINNSGAKRLKQLRHVSVLQLHHHQGAHYFLFTKGTVTLLTVTLVDGIKCTEICRGRFNVNFNIVFNDNSLVHQLVNKLSLIT